MKKKIILIVSGGCVQDAIGIPNDTEIEIRDYDVEGYDMESPYIKKDDDGDEYQEIVLTNDNG